MNGCSLAGDTRLGLHRLLNPRLGAALAVAALDRRLLGLLSHELTDVQVVTNGSAPSMAAGLKSSITPFYPKPMYGFSMGEIGRIPRADPTPLLPVIIGKPDATDRPPQNRLQLLTFGSHLSVVHLRAPFGAPWFGPSD